MIVLRPYQDDLVREALEGASRTRDYHVLFACATASGKTAMMLALASVLKDRGVLHNFHFATMSQVLVQQVVDNYSGEEVHWSDGSPLTTIPELTQDKQGRLDSVARMVRVNAAPVVMTYAALRHLHDSKALLSVGGRSTALIFDEAHHTHILDGSANADDNLKTANATGELRRRGSPLIQGTGSLDRSDGQLVWEEGMGVTVKCSVPFLMFAGYAPENILSEIVLVEGKGSDDEGFFGVPDNFQAATDKFIETFRANGSPWCILRIKPGRKSTNELVRESIKEACEREGISYVDATGPDPQEFQKHIQAEQAFVKRVKKAQAEGALSEALAEKLETEMMTFPKVIIAMGRATTGLDSPLRSMFFFWGVPQWIGVFVQGLGRILRPRAFLAEVGYPERWANTSKVAILTAGLENASEEHSKALFQLTMMLSYWEDLKALQQLMSFPDGFRDPREKHVKEILNKTPPYDEVYKVREAILIIKQLFQDALDRKLKDWPELEKVLRHHITVNKIGVCEEAIQHALALEAAKINRHRPSREGVEFNGDILAVLEEFRKDTLVSDTSHQLTAGHLEWFPRYLRDRMAYRVPPPREVMERSLRTFVAAQRRFPRRDEVDADTAYPFGSYETELGHLGVYMDQHLDDFLPFLDDGIQTYLQGAWHERLERIQQLAKSYSDQSFLSAINRRDRRQKALDSLPEYVYCKAFFDRWKHFTPKHKDNLRSLTLEEAMRRSRD